MQLKKATVCATVGVLCIVLAMQAANAWIIPALAATGRFLSGPISNTVIWLGRAGAANPTMAKALEWSITAHGALLGALWLGKSDQTASTPIEAKIVIAPKKDQVTVNPEPKRYDDVPSSTDPLQPAAKTSYSTVADNGTIPSSWITVLDALGAPAKAQYDNNPANNNWRDITTSEFQTGYATGAQYTSSAGIPSTDADGRTKQYMRLKPNTNTSCGGSSQPNCYYQVVYDKNVPKSCAAGYTLNSGTCQLTDATAVQKPAATASCEITRKSDNTWYVDPKNPECASLASAITQSADQKKLTIDNGNGQKATVTERDDGGRDIDIQDSDRWRTIKTGPYDAGLGGRPIESVSDGGGTNPNGDAGSSGGSTGGTGSSGSGGSCGGTGQPACSIDDSGFDGKATDGDGLTGKVDTHDQSIKDKLSAINPADKHGMDWTWLPSIPRVACTPFEFGTGGRVMTIDMCNTFAVIRQALGWLLYIFMAWGLFDLLVSGTTTKGRK